MKVKFFHISPWIALSAWGFLGLGTGFLNGLMGAAGGILLIMLLPHMPPLPVIRGETAVAPPQGKAVYVTGLWVILPVTVVSAVTYFIRGTMGDPRTAVLIALPAMLGGFIGAKLLGKLPRNTLRKIFGGLMLFSGIRMML